jgi:uncharacterized OsmC-like protein
MTSAELRAIQAPLKARYREEPSAARVSSFAVATLRPGAIQVSVPSGGTVIEAGLHPATGGDGSLRCSADILMEALASCAGVTLSAVAIAMGITVRSGQVRAEGEWDARGTLGVSKEVPVGLTSFRLIFQLDSDATPEQLAKLVELAERYCVVAQTIESGAKVEVVKM